MNDLVEGCRISGDILLDGVDIYKDKMDVNVLRKRVGMVFQKPNPFPMSIYDNIAYGPRTHGVRSKAQLDEIVEKSLRGAAIWDEVKDRLNKSALGMSGGQQQRLCIARALMGRPSLLVLDDSTSALDYQTDARLRQSLKKIEGSPAVLIVSQRIASIRHADFILVMDQGRLVGQGTHEELLDSCAVYQEIVRSQTREDQR